MNFHPLRLVGEKILCWVSHLAVHKALVLRRYGARDATISPW
ncbi:MAG: hypothetical protein AB8A37_02780 [Prochlorococcus sp.]|nr:hypothetical protein [Prochlorococcaceae cyanobacterium ETNP18_MAG_14]HJM80469.1 hypothetical protein [Prochlorococcaceae cyanobacterium Fu_MAG_72]